MPERCIDAYKAIDPGEKERLYPSVLKEGVKVAIHESIVPVLGDDPFTWQGLV